MDNASSVDEQLFDAQRTMLRFHAYNGMSFVFIGNGLSVNKIDGDEFALVYKESGEGGCPSPLNFSIIIPRWCEEGWCGNLCSRQSILIENLHDFTAGFGHVGARSEDCCHA